MGKHDDVRKRIRGACFELKREGVKLTTLSVRERLGGGGGTGVIQEVIKEVEADVDRWFAQLSGHIDWVGTTRDLFHQFIQESVSRAGIIFQEEKTTLKTERDAAVQSLEGVRSDLNSVQESFFKLQEQHEALVLAHNEQQIAKARLEEQLSEMKSRLQEQFIQLASVREDLLRRDQQLAHVTNLRAEVEGRANQLQEDRRAMEAALGQSERSRIALEIEVSQLKDAIKQKN